MFSRAIFLISGMLLAFVYGLATVQFEIFPYKVIQSAKNGFEALRLLEDDQHISTIRRFDAEAPAAPKITQVSPDAGDEQILMTGGFYQYMEKCPTFGCLAWITDRSGKVLHTWEVDPWKIISPEDNTRFAGDLNELNVYPIGLALGKDGSLVVTFQGRNIHPYKVGIAKITKDGEVLWSKIDNTHHWVEVSEDGTIYAMGSRESPKVKRVGGTWVGHLCPLDVFQDESIRIFSPDGEIIQELWLQDSFAKSDWPGALYSTLDGCDPVHINSVQPVSASIAANLPGVSEGDILFSARAPSAVGIINLETGIISHLAMGRVAGQHSPKFFPDGTVAVFDNLGDKHPEGGSRIVRLDLLTNRSRTIFPQTAEVPGIPFKSDVAGHLEVSRDGKRVLATTMNQSRAIEFDAETGETLWMLDHCSDLTPYLEKFDLEAKADRACFRSYGAYYIYDAPFLKDRSS